MGGYLVSGVGSAIPKPTSKHAAQILGSFWPEASETDWEAYGGQLVDEARRLFQELTSQDQILHLVTSNDQSGFCIDAAVKLIFTRSETLTDRIKALQFAGEQANGVASDIWTAKLRMAESVANAEAEITAAEEELKPQIAAAAAAGKQAIAVALRNQLEARVTGSLNKAQLEVVEHASTAAGWIAARETGLAGQMPTPKASEQASGGGKVMEAGNGPGHGGMSKAPTDIGTKPSGYDLLGSSDAATESKSVPDGSTKDNQLLGNSDADRKSAHVDPASLKSGDTPKSSSAPGSSSMPSSGGTGSSGGGNSLGSLMQQGSGASSGAGSSSSGGSSSGSGLSGMSGGDSSGGGLGDPGSSHLGHSGDGAGMAGGAGMGGGAGGAGRGIGSGVGMGVGAAESAARLATGAVNAVPAAASAAASAGTNAGISAANAMQASSASASSAGVGAGPVGAGAPMAMMPPGGAGAGAVTPASVTAGPPNAAGGPPITPPAGPSMGGVGTGGGQDLSRGAAGAAMAPVTTQAASPLRDVGSGGATGDALFEQAMDAGRDVVSMLLAQTVGYIPIQYAVSLIWERVGGVSAWMATSEGASYIPLGVRVPHEVKLAVTDPVVGRQLWAASADAGGGNPLEVLVQHAQAREQSAAGARVLAIASSLPIGQVQDWAAMAGARAVAVDAKTVAAASHGGQHRCAVAMPWEWRQANAFTDQQRRQVAARHMRMASVAGHLGGGAAEHVMDLFESRKPIDDGLWADVTKQRYLALIEYESAMRAGGQGGAAPAWALARARATEVVECLRRYDSVEGCADLLYATRLAGAPLNPNAAVA